MASENSSRRARMGWGLALGLVLLAGKPTQTWGNKIDNAAVQPVPRSADSWMRRHAALEERAKRGDVDVLFLGDSITQGWEGKGKDVWKERYEPLKAANFGISGDGTQHVRWRLHHGELESLHPKVVVLMIGTNNMGSNREGQIGKRGSSAEEIAEGITAIVGDLRQKLPDSKVLLLGIFPRSPRAGTEARDKIKDVNARIAKLDDGKNIRYLDIGDRFLDTQGNLSEEIMPDYLHLSPSGYKIWADAIQPLLDEMLKK